MKKHVSNPEAVKEKVAQAQAQLTAALESLQTSDDWRRTLETMAVLGPTSINRFSFRNILLLVSQRGTISHAATFNRWHQLGRHVRKGEKGLTVLRPRFVKERAADGTEESKLVGFSYLTVFALEQTDGEALTALEPKPITTPADFEATAETLRPLLAAVPGVAGITLRARQPGDPAGAYGWFHRSTHEIVVVTGESASPGELCATLFHEVAHAILHGNSEHHDTPTKEVEAESTAFVVAHALGLDTSTFTLPYVATWAARGNEKEPTKAVAAAGERIRKAAAQILLALCPEVAADDADAEVARAA